MGLARTQKRQKERYDNSKIFMTRKKYEEMKEGITKEVVHKVSDSLEEILEASLTDSYNWFKSDKYGENRVNKILRKFESKLVNEGVK